MTTKKITAMALSFLMVGSLSGCKRNIESYSHQDFAMGTVTNVTLYGESAELSDMEQQLVSEMKDLETKEMSWRIKDSSLGKLNASIRKSPKVSEPLKSWLEKSIEISESSYGDGRNAVDPAIGQLTKLWNFESEEPKAPEKSKISKVTEKDLTKSSNGVDIAEDGTVTCDNPETQFDLGAFGKGIGLDEAKAFLDKQKDVSGAMVALGGSILLYGQKPKAEPWQVAIMNPEVTSSTNLGMITTSDPGCISTSGDYEKYFIDEKTGKKYFHILDSKTGYSVKSDIRSCTIVCDSGIVSDGLSTACFTLGVEKSQKLLKKYNAKAVFVTRSNEVYVSDGLKFELQDKTYEVHKM